MISLLISLVRTTPFKAGECDEGNVLRNSNLQRQITVPKVVRETLAVYPGDKVAFTVDEGIVAVEGFSTDIEDLIGSIKPVAGADTSDWDRIREEAWEQAISDKYRRSNKG